MDDLYSSFCSLKGEETDLLCDMWHLVAEELGQEYDQSGPAARDQDHKGEDELVQLETLQGLLQHKLVVIILQVNQTSLTWDGTEDLL